MSCQQTVLCLCIAWTVGRPARGTLPCAIRWLFLSRLLHRLQFAFARCALVLLVSAFNSVLIFASRLRQSLHDLIGPIRGCADVPSRKVKHHLPDLELVFCHCADLD